MADLAEGSDIDAYEAGAQAGGLVADHLRVEAAGPRVELSIQDARAAGVDTGDEIMVDAHRKAVAAIRAAAPALPGRSGREWTALRRATCPEVRAR